MTVELLTKVNRSRMNVVMCRFMKRHRLYELSVGWRS